MIQIKEPEDDLMHSAAVKAAALAVALKMVGAIMAFYAMCMAAVIIFGDVARFSSPGYTVAMQIPGAPPSWGYVIGFAGVLQAAGILTQQWRLASLGAFLAAMWSMFFALTFLLSALHLTHANLTAMVVYSKDAVLFTILGVALLRQRT